MPLDQSYSGRTYPPTPAYQVGREKIREFARAIGADDPEYHDAAAARELGHSDIVAPPTFPVVVTAAVTQQLIDDPGLGLDFSRVVHTDQRFAYTRPVVAGDELVCVNTIEAILSRGRNEFLSTRTEVTTTDGAPVVTAWCRLAVRGEA
jgi:acyl dehydratase